MKLQLLGQILRFAALVPLLAYPAVLIANAMQAAALLDASQHKQSSWLRRALMSVFVGGTTIYPLVVLASYRLVDNTDETRDLAWSAAPLALLGALAGLFAILEKSENS